jgi:hypothetical protein
VPNSVTLITEHATPLARFGRRFALDAYCPMGFGARVPNPACRLDQNPLTGLEAQRSWGPSLVEKGSGVLDAGAGLCEAGLGFFADQPHDEFVEAEFLVVALFDVAGSPRCGAARTLSAVGEEDESGAGELGDLSEDVFALVSR